MESLSEEINRVYGNRVRVRVCGVLVKGNSVLLAKHRGIGDLGYLWTPPGGGVDFAESIIDTLKREFVEETGLDIEVGNFLFADEFINPPMHALELFFEVRVKGGELKSGFDPELSPGNQMIETLEFVDLGQLRNQDLRGYHRLFGRVHSAAEILHLKSRFTVSTPA